MKQQLERRLDALRVEFEQGQKELETLDAQVNSLRQTLLRISGAIQVLEEELAKADRLPSNDIDMCQGSEVVKQELAHHT